MKLILQDDYGNQREVLDRTQGVICACSACAGTVEKPRGWLQRILQMHRGARYCVEYACPEWAKWSFEDPPCVALHGHRTTAPVGVPHFPTPPPPGVTS